MKKFFLLLILSYSLLPLCEAQYTVLLNFNGPNPPDAEGPEGSLTLAGGKFYGMSYYGGPHSMGNVFSVDTNGNNYKYLFDFNGANGLNPTGEVTISGDKLYGTTEYGGINGLGNIFSIDTDGTNFKDLYDFSSAYTYPEGGNDVIVVGGVIYGTAAAGGTFPLDNGYIYSVDTNGNGFRDLFDFNGTDGLVPSGLTLSGNKFFGVTGYGGTHKCGVVFSIDTDGKNYKLLLNFDTANGAYPADNPFVIDNRLYGTTHRGGMYDSGCIFSIDTNGSGYQKLFDFNGTNGSFPYGAIALVGNVLCSTAGNVIFSIDTGGYRFTDLFTGFGSIDGAAPSGIINIGNTLYGMTTFGGTASEGVLFRYKQAGLGVNTFAANVSEENVYPNPSSGIFTVACHAESASWRTSQTTIEIYNVLGALIYFETLKQVQGDNMINLSSQPNGVYLYRVLSINGELLREGKLVIER